MGLATVAQVGNSLTCAQAPEKMEDWMCELGIDLDAQRREFERLQQAQQDRLVAEELQGDLATAEERDGSTDHDLSEQVRHDRLVAEELQGDLATITSSKQGERAFSAPQDAEQVRIDRLVAEELEGDLSLPTEVERDCSTPHEMDTDKPVSPITLKSSPIPSQTRPPQAALEAWASPTQHRQAFDGSHSSSGSGSFYGTPSELRSRSPISPLTTVIPSTTHTPPTSSLHHSPPAHPSPSVAASITFPSPPHTISLHSAFTDSDQKLAEQLQEMEKRERERCEKLVNLDHHLAMELMREETTKEEGGEGEGESEGVLEKMTEQIDMLSRSKTDAELAMALQEAEAQGREWEGETVQSDHNLAQRLQSEEDKRLNQTRIDEQLALSLNASTEPKQEDTSYDEELARQIAAQFEATPLDTTTTSTSTSQPLLARPPAWWTTCPNCSPDSNRKYHLIEITPSENEWISITLPLQNAGFTAKRLQRIQNIKLYQRLQFEKESMKMERSEDYQLNERLLYHTSSAGVDVISGEGLDQRLSRKGRFGSGVYFRYITLCVFISVCSSILQ